MSLDGGKLGQLEYPSDGGWVLRTMQLDIAKPGTHTLRLEFPVDAGDVFVDYLTLEATGR